MHDVKNVFITDGSCMTSSATQNPSLTYMALTARACDYAVNEMKKGLILKTLEQTGGSYTEAAKLLGLHPTNLHRLIRTLNIKSLLK